MINQQQFSVEHMKRCFPACSAMFDQVLRTKASEQEYKEFKAKIESGKKQ